MTAKIQENNQNRVHAVKFVELYGSDFELKRKIRLKDWCDGFVNIAITSNCKTHNNRIGLHCS